MPGQQRERNESLTLLSLAIFDPIALAWSGKFSSSHRKCAGGRLSIGVPGLCANPSVQAPADFAAESNSVVTTYAMVATPGLCGLIADLSNRSDVSQFDVRWRANATRLVRSGGRKGQ